MDLDSLLPIANKFISSEAGKKIFGEINIGDALQEITSINQEISSSKATFSASLQSTQDLASDAQTGVGRFISSSLDKIKKLKKRNIPRFTTFETTGRIFDKQTNKPLSGVEVIPGISLIEALGTANDGVGKTGVQNEEIDKYLDSEKIFDEDIGPDNFF